MGMFAAKKEIGPDTVLQRRNDILFNEVDGEVVILSVKNGQYYGLDKVGARIWKLIEKPQPFINLVSDLKNYYEVSDEKCTYDTILFLNRLHEMDLLIDS